MNNIYRIQNVLFHGMSNRANMHQGNYSILSDLFVQFD